MGIPQLLSLSHADGRPKPAQPSMLSPARTMAGTLNAANQ